MRFGGFEPEDFHVFSIPDFEGRMAEIRGRIRPKLTALGEDLQPWVEETAGHPMHVHVAQHMRRRVNPPVETWVAFARDKKGYKRWSHYRVAISEAGIRVTSFVEDDADDKAQLGANLESGAEEILRALGPGAPIAWYTLNGEAPVTHGEVGPERLRKLGGSLQRLKTLKFQAGVPIPAERALAMTPAELEAWAGEQVRVLRPLYLAGAVAGYRPAEGD